MDARFVMYEKLEVLEMYRVRERKRKKRAAPRVCTARFFRSYKLEICYLVLCFSYLYYTTSSSKNKSRSKFFVSACFTRTPRRVRHFGPWLRQALSVRHLRRKFNTKKTAQITSSCLYCYLN